MSNYYKRSKKNSINKANQSLSILYLLPIIFIIAFVPLIVFAKIITLDGLEAKYLLDRIVQFNFFHYYKAIYFILASYLGGIILLALYWTKKLTFIKTKYYIPLGVYLFFAILSAVFADDIDVALRGSYDLSQGIFVLIGYVIFIITIINIVREEKHIKMMLWAFIFVSLIIGLIGVGQYFGHDIFKTEFGKLLILPKELHSLSDSLNFHFAEYAVYATLYNTNFVGSFAALMIPFSFALYFYQKKPVYLFASITFVGVIVFIGFGSNSRAGIIGVIASLILMGILFRKMIVRKPLQIILPLVVLVMVGFGLNKASEGRIFNSIKNLSFIKDVESAQLRNEFYLEDLIFDDYTLDIITNEQDLHLEFFQNDLHFSNLEGNSLEVIKSGTRITFVDESFQNFVFTRSASGAYYNVNAYGRSFNLYLTIDGFKIEGLSGVIELPSNPDKIDFLEGYGSMFSSRVYIWSRSIPLLKKTIIIGAGPDMFPLIFPQDDYVGKINNRFTNILVDKPHNMYLQTGINTGVISLIALLSVFAIYLVDSFKLFINNSFLTFKDYIGAGLFAGVTAYLVSGIFNDQIMSVAPLFYGMLALGIAINRLIRLEAKE